MNTLLTTLFAGTIDIYLAIAIFATAIFLIQFVMSVFFGSVDMDLDIDGDGDMDAGSVFSVKGVINFLMGFGWCKYLFGGDSWESYAMAVLVGIVFMLVVFFVYFFAYKLQKVRKAETPSMLIGRTGTIYTSLGNGRYIVQIEHDGALREIEVESKSGKADIPTMSKVTIESTKDSIFYIN